MWSQLKDSFEDVKETNTNIKVDKPKEKEQKERDVKLRNQKSIGENALHAFTIQLHINQIVEGIKKIKSDPKLLPNFITILDYFHSLDSDGVWQFIKTCIEFDTIDDIRPTLMTTVNTRSILLQLLKGSVAEIRPGVIEWKLVY